MKNIQVIDGAQNSVYHIFGAMEQEFSLIFPADQDVAFIDEVLARGPEDEVAAALNNISKRRIARKDSVGIHGLLSYGLEHKKSYYPTRRDEEAVNPSGSPLR